MSMPPQRSSLSCDVEIVSITVSSLDGALCYIRWSISPTIALLLQVMPIFKRKTGSLAQCLVMHARLVIA